MLMFRVDDNFTLNDSPIKCKLLFAVESFIMYLLFVVTLDINWNDAPLEKPFFKFWKSGLRIVINFYALVSPDKLWILIVESFHP